MLLCLSTQKHVEQLTGYMDQLAKSRGADVVYGVLCSDAEYSFTKLSRGRNWDPVLLRSDQGACSAMAQPHCVNHLITVC